MGSSDIECGCPLLPKQSDKQGGTRGSLIGRTGVAGEGYTIGRPCQHMDPPHGGGRGGEPLRLWKGRDRQPVLEGILARGDERVDLFGRDARHGGQDIAESAAITRIHALLPRVNGERAGKTRHQGRRDALNPLQFADALEGRIGRHQFRPGRPILRRFGA